MKSRGLTLVELLAVFVLLGIIALIAIPSVVKVREKSKEKAFLNSAKGVIESVNLLRSQNELQEIPEEGIEISNSYLKLKNQSQYTTGFIKKEDDKIILENVSNGEFCANGTLSDLEVTNGACGQPDSCFTVEDGVVTNYDFSNPECTNDLIVPNKIYGEEIIGIGKEAFIEDKTLDLACTLDTENTMGVNRFSREYVTNKNIIQAENNEDLFKCVLVNAFYDEDYVNPLTSVVLPRSLKFIDENAFTYAQFENLNISYLDNLTEIRAGAFANIKNLNSIKLPKNLKLIGAWTFANIPYLEVNFTDLVDLEVIDAFSFENTGITKIDLSKSINIREIRYGAFQNAPTNPLVVNFGDKSKIEMFSTYNFDFDHGVLEGWTNLTDYTDHIKDSWLRNALTAAGY